MMTLREHRRRKLLSIRELAALAGVSTQAVLDAEHGRRASHLRTIRRICAALGVDPLEVAEFAAVLTDSPSSS